MLTPPLEPFKIIIVIQELNKDNYALWKIQVFIAAPKPVIKDNKGDGGKETDVPNPTF